MSAYYAYEFKSAAPLFARIKEEWKSYFDSGLVDEVLFPTWVKDCIRQFKRTFYQIREEVLTVDCGMCELPEDFKYAREVWLCSEDGYIEWEAPGVTYYQSDIRLDMLSEASGYQIPAELQAAISSDPECRTVHKLVDNYIFSFTKTMLLKPGNHNAIGFCKNYNSRGQGCETFDIRGNKMMVTPQTGNIYLIYYSEQFDENGVLMIPDQFEMEEFIRKYIRFQIADLIWANNSPETFNQDKHRRDTYEVEMNRAFYEASHEAKKETVWDKRRKIIRSYNRHNKYGIR